MLGETVPRTPLGSGERQRPRSSPGREAGNSRRVCGGRAAQAFGKGAGALSSFAGNARKNDGLDALATALAASRHERLAAVDHETASEVLRLLSERREDLVAERTRALNRLHGLLRDLLPGGVGGTLSAHRAARILRGIRPRGASSRVRRRLASEILRDVRTLDRKIADLNERIEAEVEASGTTLTEIFGIGPILAARIIGTVGNVARFPSKAHFASYSGTAPVEASSGEVVRHKLSLAGNRHLNRAHCTWWRYARPDRTLGAGVTTARRSRRASPVRRRCVVSRGASQMPSSRASWLIRWRLLAALLDKEEPRTLSWRSAENLPSTTLR
jgi:transposase